MTRSPAVEAVGLTKNFKDVHALAGLDLIAPAGKVTAVLGPNGAGKSTFVRAVATLLRLDEGHLLVEGIDALAHPEQVRRVIGLAGQNAAVEPALTGRENLVMVGRMFGHSASAAADAASVVLREIELTDDADRLVKDYSGGMRRRLDPRTRMELWESIRSLVASGTDVLLTTQYLEEADQLADHVVIIDHGRTIATGTPSELKALAGRDVIDVRATHADDVGAIAGLLGPIGLEPPTVDEPGRRVTVAVADGPGRLGDAVRLLTDAGLALDDIGLRRPTLDEVFLALTGSPA